MKEIKDFMPDWVSPPGDTMADILEERSLSPVELARRMGDTTEHINELLSGRAAITAEVAWRLARVLGLCPSGQFASLIIEKT